ncbi:MAG TPA: PadR family transcriptional regulator [Chryseosolibacter sp.]
MSGRIYLGELEELILLMVALIGVDAYGVLIVRELEEQTGRVITLSAAHAALHRLEEKGFVKSKMGGASADRGGRRKRLFQVTSYGRQTLEELRDVRNIIWAQLSNS